MDEEVNNGSNLTKNDEIKKEFTGEEPLSLSKETNTTNVSESDEISKSLKQECKIILKRKHDIEPEKCIKKRRTRIVLQEYSSCSDEEEYSLTVCNLPNTWTYVQIKKYIDQECGHVDEIEMLNPGNSLNCAIKLIYPTLENCKEAMRKLQDKEVEGRKLELHMNGFYDDSNQKEVPGDETSNASDTEPAKSQNTQDSDEWYANPEDQFRLRPEFLKSLGIKPPLDKWVHVENFRCDKAELRDVMELAGHVLMCTVVKVAHRYAKVMYSHPLEAVQAVSMLDGQIYYGQALKVTMEINPSDVFVTPKGLPNIGLGLGVHGRPIRNITKHYKMFLRRQSSLINPILFNDLDNQEAIVTDKAKKDIHDLMESMKNNKRSLKIKNIEDLDSNAANTSKLKEAKSKDSSVASNTPELSRSPNTTPKPNNPQTPIRPEGPQNLNVPLKTFPIRSTLSNSVQNFRAQAPISIAHISAPIRPLNAPSNRFGPVPGQYNMPGPGCVPQPRPTVFVPGPVPQCRMNVGHGPGPYVMNPAQMTPQGNSATVRFSNLPPTTTFPMLCDKLSSCGQVVSVQLTTPGCAVATFAHRAHAERCFQTFNGVNAEGFIINVTFA